VRGVSGGNVISMRTNFPEVGAALDRLGEDIGNKALVRAINVTVDQGKPAMAKQISAEFRVRSSDVKQRLTVVKAVARGGVLRFEASLAASNRGKGRSMNLIAFVDQVVTLAQARKRMAAGEGGVQTLRRGGQVQKALQLKFQIKRSGGKKTIPGAFIGNKGRTVFIRQGKGRLPIKALNTIDVPQMFNAKRINSVVRNVMLQRFPANFRRELRGVLGGFAK
jgi:hypothetical protein